MKEQHTPSPYSKVSWLLLITLVTAIIFTGMLTAGIALFIGLAAALLFNNPFATQCRTYSTHCLKIAIVGMGFGMNISEVTAVAWDTLGMTLATIALALGFAWVLGRWLLVEKNTTLLIGSGTAICGGSAIAAISQVIRAKPEQITIAVTTIFLLNVVALYLFPWVGRWLELSQLQFGVWAALAIHDTSSVVGAAADYGTEALNIATTTKLSRALWILPLTVIGAMLYRDQEGDKKVVLPLFILLFVVASIINSILPNFNKELSLVVAVAKNLLVTALFLLGLGFTRDLFHRIDRKPLILGILLWLLVSTIALIMVKMVYSG